MIKQSLKIFEEELELVNKYVEHMNQKRAADEEEWTIDDVLQLAFQNGLRKLLKQAHMSDGGFYDRNVK